MAVIKRGIVKSYDAASHKAAVQIVGSLAVWLDSVPVATDIPAADIVAGRQCTVLFLDPSNPDAAVVITIQGANPSVPSGATVAASATVVSETAFGQASAPGAASPYSRGDHTHGTPTDPITAHVAAADPHTVYGALAQAETWAALQTFAAGVKLTGLFDLEIPSGRFIKQSALPRIQMGGFNAEMRFIDDLSVARLDIFAASPHVRVIGDTQFAPDTQLAGVVIKDTNVASPRLTVDNVASGGRKFEVAGDLTDFYFYDRTNAFYAWRYQFSTGLTYIPQGIDVGSTGGGTRTATFRLPSVLLTGTGDQKMIAETSGGVGAGFASFTVRSTGVTPTRYMEFQLMPNTADATTYVRYNFVGSTTIVDILTLDGAGKVAIGANRQAEKLHVAGDGRYTSHLRMDGDLDHRGSKAGFYGTAPIVKQTGVAVTAAAIHAALVNLGLIAA